MDLKHSTAGPILGHIQNKENLCIEGNLCIKALQVMNSFAFTLTTFQNEQSHGERLAKWSKGQSVHPFPFPFQSITSRNNKRPNDGGEEALGHHHQLPPAC